MINSKFAMGVSLLAALAVPLAQAAAKTTRSATLADESKQTLQQIRASAVAVENEADQIRMMIARPGFSPESSLSQLLAVKDKVNRMGKEIHSLEAERGSLPVWEQRAIGQTLPLLQATAADTQGAIEYFNDNRSLLWTGTSRGYADRIYNQSSRIATTLRDYFKYDRLREREQRLQREINATGAELGM